MNVIPLRQPETKRRKSEAAPISPTFGISSEVKDWAQSRGITKLAERLEHFTDYCRATGKEYKDFDAAFRNACRQDWARLGTNDGVQAMTCAKCHGSLSNGWTGSSKGKLCNSCYASR